MSLHPQEVKFIPQPLNLDWSCACFDQENEEELVFWYIKTQNFLSLRTQMSMLWSPSHMKKTKWDLKHSDQQCQLSSLTSQHQLPHIEVGCLGRSNQVKLPEDCSPNWHIVKQKGCPTKSSQPTETWDNDYCFKSLNSGVVSHAAIDHLHMGILLIYLNPKPKIMLNWKRLEIVPLKSKIR